MIKYYRVLPVLIGVLGLLWTWSSRPQTGATEPPSQVATRIGALAPDVTLKALDGSTYSLSSLRGKSVVLNFWASWCPPCRAEMAALNNVYTDYRGRDVIVLGVNQMESANTAQGFITEQQLSFQFSLDTDGTISQQYHVAALPTTYYIDKQGIIRDIVYGGPMTRPLIESKVLALTKN
jgi:peroxiredoxin